MRAVGFPRQPLRVQAGTSFSNGFTLVEVLVGIAVLAVVSGVLVALQVGSLRAARTAHDVRALAAAGDYQLGLARLLPGLSACRDLESWPAVETCVLESACLAAACLRRSIDVRLTSVAGRQAAWHTIVDDQLEGAPHGNGPSGGAAGGP